MMLALIIFIASGLMLHQFLPATASLNGRVFKGFEAFETQFPYQVHITIKSGQETFQCSGALIGKRWVLTAAHCFDGANHKNVKMYLGGVNIDSLEEFKERRAVALYIHENYNNQTVQNDIALVKMFPVRYSTNIRPIPLMEKSNYILTGRVALISGWGAKGNHGFSSSRLLYTVLTIIPAFKCREYFSHVNIHANEFCAKEEFSSPCPGDSGAPLVRVPYGVLVGILSGTTEGDCESGAPSIYTRVSSYRDWIRKITGV